MIDPVEGLTPLGNVVGVGGFGGSKNKMIDMSLLLRKSGESTTMTGMAGGGVNKSQEFEFNFKTKPKAKTAATEAAEQAMAASEQYYNRVDNIGDMLRENTINSAAGLEGIMYLGDSLMQKLNSYELKPLEGVSVPLEQMPEMSASVDEKIIAVNENTERQITTLGDTIKDEEIVQLPKQKAPIKGSKKSSKTKTK